MALLELSPTRTIVAIASADGSAPRGIVRLSGPQSVAIATSLCLGGKPYESAKWAQWQTVELAIPDLRSPIPATILVWPDDRSYTRQPAAEIHLPGSRPLMEAVVSAACGLGASLAQPGEFTLRAFLAGRIDLSQAEAIVAAVDAKDKNEFEWALAQTAGGLRDPLEQLRSELLDLLAHLEAGLDFVEEDIAFIGRAELQTGLAHARMRMEQLLDQIRERHVSNDSYRVALVGRPNAGKSSLFNALLGQKAAIATRHAGTTRDYLVGKLSLPEIEVELIDTAGLTGGPFLPNRADRVAPTSDVVGSVGSVTSLDSMIQQQSLRVAEQANLIIVCAELDRLVDDGEVETLAAHRVEVLRVRTKSDLHAVREGGAEICVSSVTGEGLEKLKQAIQHAATKHQEHPSTTSLAAARCVESLARASDAIRRAEHAGEARAGDEWIAAEVRLALDELGRVVGAVYNDELLDRIFSRFCIGK